jgi:hypothetical protein
MLAKKLQPVAYQTRLIGSPSGRLAAGLSHIARAQTYPTRPVCLIAEPMKKGPAKGGAQVGEETPLNEVPKNT